ncbi:MAG TPA: Mur ligase family protein [Gemmatimonadales bacterium]|nr:Mur ligase family protein [Gemmatimonadales bacterium]
MPLTYDDALAFLFPRTTTIKFGLDTTRALLDGLGNPQNQFVSLHIGGTNGKGSVAALVASALREAGWTVGLYTSPHLCSFRERIVVDGIPISESAVAMWTERLQPELIRREATFFETTSVIAFADFAARGAEIGVVEVGLGGRLDSTNVLAPLVSGITRIARDHMKYLGESLADIAREKAGIAKPGVPFIVGEEDPAVVAVLCEEARRAVEAASVGARADIRVIPPDRRWEGALGLVGEHQRRNAVVAEAMLAALPAPYRPSPGHVGRGFATTRLPGRLQRHGKWLFDVAHNPNGVETLVAAIGSLEPPRPLNALVSILGDKEWAEMLIMLDTVIDRGVLTMAPTAAARGWSVDWLDRWLADQTRPPARASWRLIPDFEEAVREVQRDARTVLVTGSFHTVGDVMNVLGLAPL